MYLQGILQYNYSSHKYHRKMQQYQAARVQDGGHTRHRSTDIQSTEVIFTKYQNHFFFAINTPK